MISGGERQLALLARALAQEPRFIVLDEPTASLDFGNQGKVMREIRALASSGHGVLFTTHDPNHAMRAADRAYLLRDGVRMAEGAVAEVLTRDRLEALYDAPVDSIRATLRHALGTAMATRRTPAADVCSARGSALRPCRCAQPDGCQAVVYRVKWPTR
jgi:ABC-type cobalamin/Fe3+-siderophores transport system ATPase subunit